METGRRPFDSYTESNWNMRRFFPVVEPFIHTVFAKVYITSWNTPDSLLKTLLKMLISVETTPLSRL
ncbi:hypothetical protein LY85_2139 [Clostridium sp. KNHs216]|nr:hypothetical protein LY85_2139 [Clostridium sp. KNHs216]